MFRSQSNNIEDYHSQMDVNIFRSWFDIKVPCKNVRHYHGKCSFIPFNVKRQFSKEQCSKIQYLRIVEKN